MSETKQRTPIRAGIRERIAGDGNVGQAPAKHIPTTGNARVETDEIDIVSEGTARDLVANLAFMDEVLEIVVLPTADKNESNIVQVYNNGIAQFFVRGQRQKVKRKFVECLARSKPIDYDVQIKKDETTGEVINSLNPRTASLKYPFEVKHDPSGARGEQWLNDVLMQP